MENIRDALREAFMRVMPGLLADPVELAARLQRRRRVMREPPRAWCLAVRASDTRITPATAVIRPERAVAGLYKHRTTATGLQRRRVVKNWDPVYPHRVRLDSLLLSKICPPVWIRYGDLWREAAGRLGVSGECIRNAGKKGHVWLVRRLGENARPTLEVAESKLLDPSSSNFCRPPDPVWVMLWQYAMYELPQIEQEVERVPVYRPNAGFGRGRRDEEDEEGMRDEGEKEVTEGEDYSEGALYGKAFGGWRWVCPGCGERVRTLFYPLAPIRVTGLPYADDPRLKMPAVSRAEGGGRTGEGANGGNGDEEDADDSSYLPMPTFACVRCHRVRYFSRVTASGWSHLVGYLSAGLLYGQEVTRPRWYAEGAKRKKRVVKQVNRPAPRREETLRLMVTTALSYGEIAARMGVKYDAVESQRKHLFKQYKVKSREGLARAAAAGKWDGVLGAGSWRPERRKREEVLRRLRAGEGWHEIARGMGVKYAAVASHARVLYRELGVKSKRELASGGGGGKGARARG